jgi:hypothetical protein
MVCNAVLVVGYEPLDMFAVPAGSEIHQAILSTEATRNKYIVVNR